MNENQLYVEDFYDAISRSRTAHIKVICPFCHERRTNKRDKSLSIECSTLLYHCHYCQATGKLKYRREEYQKMMQTYNTPKKKEYIRPQKKVEVRDDGYPASFAEYFKGRGISVDTLKKCKVTKEKEWMPQTQKETACIAFNYFLNGELINVKYRTRDKGFKLIPNAELLPYNIDSISQASYKDDEDRYAIFVEGEMDALTYVECGYTHVVSCPNGANGNLSYLDNYIDDYFEPLDYIYISVDNDTKGMKFREELLHRFGKERCRVINYPEPCKDINEVLMQYGKDAVHKCIESYIEIKPEGILEVSDVENELDYLFDNGYEAGIKVGDKALDEIVSFKTGLLTIVTGVPSHGKALSLDTPLPSPQGWINMGDIKLGDKLYDENGNVCTVTFVTPIQYNRKCYKVVFSDGSEIICDADHLWVTRDNKARCSESRYQKRIKNNGTAVLQKRGTDQSYKRTFPKMRNTEEIKNTLYVDGSKRVNHHIRVQGFLKNESNGKLLIDPYLLGCWLGDGTSSSNGITTGDVEVIENIKNAGYTVVKHKYKYGYGIKGLTAQLRTLGVLNNKKIPMQYLRSDYENRLALLRGLMDSDGYCAKNGSCIYYTTNKCLLDCVYELLMTMGVKATICVKKSFLNGERKKDCFAISFSPNFNCFTLKRKSSRIRSRYNDKVNWRGIVSIEDVDSVPVRCIQVDSPNHMYLCGKSMIPTHNTFALNYILTKLNILHDWKVAFFSPEFYPVHEHIGQIMETFGGKRFRRENYSYIEYDTMKEYVSNNFFWIDPNDTELKSVLERARYLIRRRGIKALVIDPFNSLTDKERGNQKKDEYISDFLQDLRHFARFYGIAVFLVMHPTKLAKLENGLYPVCDLYNCKGASEVNDKADIGITVWRNKDQDYCEIHIVKIKFRHLGKLGYATYKFNINNGRYVEIPHYDTFRLNGKNINDYQVNWDNSNYIINKLKNANTQQTFMQIDKKDNDERQDDPFGMPIDGVPF